MAEMVSSGHQISLDPAPVSKRPRISIPKLLAKQLAAESDAGGAGMAKCGKSAAGDADSFCKSLGLMKPGDNRQAAVDTALIAAGVAAAAAKAAAAAAKAAGTSLQQEQDSCEKKVETIDIEDDEPEVTVVGHKVDLTQGSDEDSADLKPAEDGGARTLNQFSTMLLNNLSPIILNKVVSVGPADGFVKQESTLHFTVRRHPLVTGCYCVIGTVHECHGSKDAIAYLVGNIIDRPTVNFFSSATEVNPELQQLAWTFCDSSGRVTRVDHPEIRDAGPQVHEGGFLHLLQVEVHPDHRSLDLGLWMVHQALSLLRGKWTFAVVDASPMDDNSPMFGSSKNADDVDEAEDDDDSPAGRLRIAQAGYTLRRFFARMGFAQAGRTPELAQLFFMTPHMYFPGDIEPEAAMSRWVSKAEGTAADVYDPPSQHVSEGLDEELMEAMNRYYVRSCDRIRAMKDLVVRGASIHGSRAMFVAAANEGSAGIEHLKELVELGGNVNDRDEDGNTPLHIAASFLCPQAVEYLLQQGASRAIKNNQGETPKMIWDSYASEPGNEDFMVGTGMEIPSDEIRDAISAVL